MEKRSPNAKADSSLEVPSESRGTPESESPKRTRAATPLGAFLSHPAWLGIGALVGLAGLLVLLGAFTGGAARSGKSGQATSAVSEIAERQFWSSPPITYSEANKAVSADERMPHGTEPDFATEEDGEEESLTEAPRAILAGELTTNAQQYVRTGSYDFQAGRPVAVVGKVVAAESLKSDFLGTAPEGSRLRPVTQVRLQVLEGDGDLYVESPEIEVGIGDVIVALGWVAATGSTDHNTVKVVYLLASRAETMSNSIDSNALRTLYKEAQRGKTRAEEEHERDRQLEREADSGSGAALIP